MTEKVVWQMLQPYAEAAGVPGIVPHDLRRKCAKLMPGGWRPAGADPVAPWSRVGQTTERYLGTKQDLIHAPNDAIKLKVAM